MKDLDAETARIDAVLKVYGTLEVKINMHLENDNKESRDSLLETISTSYSYLSRSLYKECEAYYTNHSKGNLKNDGNTKKRNIINEL